MAKSKGKSLCRLVEGKILKKDPGAYLELIENPRFLCMRCGRTAHRKRVLCDPTRLEGAG